MERIPEITYELTVLNLECKVPLSVQIKKWFGDLTISIDNIEKNPLFLTEREPGVQRLIKMFPLKIITFASRESIWNSDWVKVLSLCRDGCIKTLL